MSVHSGSTDDNILSLLFSATNSS
ncbi:hypothetical protein JL09_g6876 [Pichia kudriavzevii]|uniref:Uncharacterized protein n=1 Tax=Pichia kudriavzevii TaxID=4909 RepID=A0A099NKS4_PICKU|nr:hypothetical protein JL09_g6876 [Pichia kudriavzevii]